MATLFKPDGTTEEISLIEGNRSFTLDQLQEAVGGLIEIVPTADGRLMVINEEGKLLNLPYNPKATMLYGSDWDIIAGPALVCEKYEIE